MKYSNKRLEILLSLYIDDELSLAERIEVESILKQSSEARTQLRELQQLKVGLGQKAPLPENPDFYSELHRNLPRPILSERSSWMIPRKFRPAFAGLGALAMIVVVSLAVLKKDEIVDLFSKTTQDVQQAYEENVVNGWIMPLFDKTDRDEALQYAMFGVLPLDDSSNTILKVDNSVEKGYTFELGQANTPHFEPVTVEDLYREVEPTEDQRQVLDTIFYLASKQIEEGVLVDEKEQLAIAPSVIDLQRSLIAKVAATLDESRRERMEQFLQARNAYFSVRTTNAPPVPKATLVNQIEKNAESNTFVMISRDTILLSQLAVDRRQIRANMARVRQTQRRMQVYLTQVTEKLSSQYRNTGESSQQVERHLTATAPPVHVGSGNVGMRVHITIDRGASQGFVASYVEPRKGTNKTVTWNARSNVLSPPSGQTARGETRIELKIEMDSMLSIQENALRQMEKQLQKLDSHQWEMESEEGNVYLNLDSLEKIIRITTDSMHIELRKTPNIELRAPKPDSALPPGIEIRPDYYEEEQRHRDGRQQYILDSYRNKLREYKTQHQRLKKVTTTSTVSGSTNTHQENPQK